jgi:murein lipoprotein
MMKTVKISAVILAACLATGCASTSDIENLQTQIDSMQTDVQTASSEAAKANAAVSEAVAKASAAEAAANRAAQYAQDTNSKLDRMFKKSMMK